MNQIIILHFMCYLKDISEKVKIFHQNKLLMHTIRKCQKMARQNTFEILLLNDANMIRER